MKSGELFDKRKFPSEGDADALKDWCFKFAEDAEQLIIKLVKRVEKLENKLNEKGE